MNISFHPHLSLPDAARIARDQGCVLVYAGGRVRMARASAKVHARWLRCLALMDRSLELIQNHDFAGANACAAEARKSLE